MSFYSRVIFPRLCDLLLDKPFVTRHRREVLATASGAVLEIGFGTGLNLACYPEAVRKITTVEPSVGMNRLAQIRVSNSGKEVDQRIANGEQLPFDDCTFDCAVSTFTLCSIGNVPQAMSEVYRVLKPEGQFLFLEHGLSPEPKVQKWQRRLNWLQSRIADGCQLDRNIRELVAAQPFTSVEIEEFYLERTPKTHGYIYRGVSCK